MSLSAQEVMQNTSMQARRNGFIYRGGVLPFGCIKQGDGLCTDSEMHACLFLGLPSRTLYGGSWEAIQEDSI